MSVARAVLQPGAMLGSASMGTVRVPRELLQVKGTALEVCETAYYLPICYQCHHSATLQANFATPATTVPSLVQEYVRNRLMQFIRAFALRMVQLVPQVSPGLLESIVRETFDILPSPDYGQVPVDELELQLVFRHDCM